MDQTPKTGIPYPSEGADPWFQPHEQSLEDVDSQTFALRENRDIYATDGGVFTFTASTGLLTWDSSIFITAPLTGFRTEIVAGSISLEDGEYLYFNLTRGPSANLTAIPQKAQVVPNTNEAYSLAYRKGSSVYFRQGVLIDGASISILSAPPSAEVTFLQAGVVVATRPKANFVSGMLVVDNAPFNRVDLTVAAGASVWTCPAGVVVGDMVYISASDTVDRANATSIATAPAIGCVVSKPTATSASVLFDAQEVALFLGLTPGAVYYLDTADGQITTVAPAVVGNVVQRVGYARNATTLVLHIGNAFTVL